MTKRQAELSRAAEEAAVMNQPPCVLMTVEELAARWGVNPRTIRGEIEAGRIKVLRIGRLIKISRSHIELLEQGG